MGGMFCQRTGRGSVISFAGPASSSCTLLNHFVARYASMWPVYNLFYWYCDLTMYIVSVTCMGRKDIMVWEETTRRPIGRECTSPDWSSKLSRTPYLRHREVSMAPTSSRRGDTGQWDQRYWNSLIARFRWCERAQPSGPERDSIIGHFTPPNSNPRRVKQTYQLGTI